MIRLLLSDARRHLGSWMWVVAVAMVAASCVMGQLMLMNGGLSAADTVTDAAARAEFLDATRVTGAFCTVSIVIAAVTVLSTSVGTVISQRSRDHGLWRALGMKPIVLRLILLAQMLLIGALGAAAGLIGGWPVSRLLIPLFIEQHLVPPTTRPEMGVNVVLIGVAVVAASVMLGGWFAARRAARATEMELLSGRVTRRRWTIGRVLLLVTKVAMIVGCIAGLIAAGVAINRAAMEISDAVQAAVSAAFALLTLVGALTSWMVPVFNWCMARLPIPGVAWQVAARTAVRQARSSSSSSLPFVIAIGLVAVMYGVNRALKGQDIELSAFFITFGLAIVTSWMGGVAVIAMSAGRRRHDGALLIAAGATPGTVLKVDVIEGVLHAVAAIALGCVVSIGSSAFLAAALHRPFGELVASGPWAAIAVIGVLTLVTTCLAVVLSSRLGRRETTAQILRARD